MHMCSCRNAAPFLPPFYPLLPQGDIWVETRLMGIGKTCFACLDQRVYEINEWGQCNVRCRPRRGTAHSWLCVRFRLTLRRPHPPFLTESL